MARMGMDVDLVEQSGRQLKSQASQINGLVTQMDRLVNGLTAVWDGPDAQRFVHDWWPQHRKSLVAAQQQIDGLGQSALNNASEQRQVSSGGGSGGSGAHTGAAVAGGAAAAAAGGGAATAVKTGTNGGATGAADRNAAAVTKFADKWTRPGTKPIDVDGNGAWCFDVFREYNTEVTGAPSSIAKTSDHASAIYLDYDHNGVSQYYDRIPAGQGGPQPGDVIVYADHPNNLNYGHVAVVTDVSGSNYTVVEQGYATNAPPRSHTYAMSDNTSAGQVLGYLRPKNVKT